MMKKKTKVEKLDLRIRSVKRSRSNRKKPINEYPRLPEKDTIFKGEELYSNVDVSSFFPLLLDLFRFSIFHSSKSYF